MRLYLTRDPDALQFLLEVRHVIFHSLLVVSCQKLLLVSFELTHVNLMADFRPLVSVRYSALVGDACGIEDLVPTVVLIIELNRGSLIGLIFPLTWLGNP